MMVVAMRERAMLEGRELASTVERLAGRFATACGVRVHGPEVRDLAHELLLDVVGALRVASIGEIADALATLQRRPKTRASAGTRSLSDASSDRGRPGHARKPAPAARRGSADLPPEPAAPSRRSRDPFDITKPGELLDPTAVETRREEEHPPSSERRAFRQPRGERDPGHVLVSRPRGQAAGGAAVPSEAPPVEPPPPVVTLREGEHLLRAGGSGVVIRRVRIA
jgi:hypothetical protein